MKRFFCFVFAVTTILPFFAGAQELYEDLQGVWRAEVMRVVEEHAETVGGTDMRNTIQLLEVKLLEGEREGEMIMFSNDFIPLKEGNRFYLNYLKTINGDEIYSVREVDRRRVLWLLGGLFAAVIVFFGGLQGLRALVSLIGSLLVVVYVLLPLLVKGYAPIPTSAAIAGVILFFAIFFTHGFTKKSVIAYAGTLIAVILTGILAYVSVHAARLTGFASEEALYLNLGTRGELDLVGLLLAAIIIGALGVLDDIAVTQVSVVRELYEADSSLTKKEAYQKAIRVGKDHVGALVNTLVLAYTGAALPLLLLFSQSTTSFTAILNREVFATEIVRTLAGSMGLILAVPITTLLAVWFLKKKKSPAAHERTAG